MNCNCDACNNRDYDIPDDENILICDICGCEILSGEDYFKEKYGDIYCELCIDKHMCCN